MKGDGHSVVHNTAVDGTYILFNDPTVSYMFQKPGDPLNISWPGPLVRPCLWSESQNAEEGTTTELIGNAADSIHLGNSKSWNNTIGGFDAGVHLRDVWNWDFRPCPLSIIAEQGTGAYPATFETHYWIPGRQLWQASMPIPKHLSMNTKLDTDLMFLPALGATSHTIKFGGTASTLKEVAVLNGEDNVFNLSARFILDAHTTYYWSVDAVVMGGTVEGEVWSFTTGITRSCVF